MVNKALGQTTVGHLAFHYQTLPLHKQIYSLRSIGCFFFGFSDFQVSEAASEVLCLRGGAIKKIKKPRVTSGGKTAEDDCLFDKPMGAKYDGGFDLRVGCLIYKINHM
uniref:RH56396p n=1 Tax=Drosophila melanogaster TaxID=7227 RepID=Q8IGC6_DROME|nr:RH56396p [Drosophila melanogaster]